MIQSWIRNFADFKRALEQNDLSNDFSQIKKLKTEAKVSSSFQLKGISYSLTEFNSSLLDSINTAFDHLHEGDLSGVNKELENVIINHY